MDSEVQKLLTKNLFRIRTSHNFNIKIHKTTINYESRKWHFHILVFFVIINLITWSNLLLANKKRTKTGPSDLIQWEIQNIVNALLLIKY